MITVMDAHLIRLLRDKPRSKCFCNVCFDSPVSLSIEITIEHCTISFLVWVGLAETVACFSEIR
jgi:hypothetical protein